MIFQGSFWKRLLGDDGASDAHQIRRCEGLCEAKLPKVCSCSNFDLASFLLVFVLCVAHQVQHWLDSNLLKWRPDRVTGSSLPQHREYVVPHRWSKESDTQKDGIVGTATRDDLTTADLANIDEMKPEMLNSKDIQKKVEINFSINRLSQLVELVVSQISFSSGGGSLGVLVRRMVRPTVTMTKLPRQPTKMALRRRTQKQRRSRRTRKRFSPRRFSGLRKHIFERPQWFVFEGCWGGGGRGGR